MCAHRGVMCLHMKTQDYLGTIDPDAAIQMNPEDYLSDDDLAANSLHVLDCMRLFCQCIPISQPALDASGAAGMLARIGRVYIWAQQGIGPSLAALGACYLCRRTLRQELQQLFPSHERR